MLIIYCICTLAITTWLAWGMYRHLDQYDWHYHRLDIWVDFWLTLIFWPLIAVLRPSLLYRPAFKFDRPWGDAAECTRQRISFMENPPPCASTVVYLAFRDDDKERNGIFYFSAANVQAMAEHMRKEHTSLEGMYGAARWTSFRDESLSEPTEVPELLVNFDHIAEDLIEAGHGQVRCLACDKIYSVSELERKTIGFPASARSGWIYANFICPARHSLLLRQVMHIMRRMADD
jgi:hypothetical protein